MVSTFTVNTDSQVELSPINLLLQVPTIKAYLRNFAYLRCGLKIRIELLTTPMQFGALGVSWLPYIGDGLYTQLKAQSQSSMHIMDLCQQESLNIELPYLRPPLYYDLSDTVQLDWRLICFGFVVDTITAGSPSSVVANMFVSLLEPEAAGFVPASGVFQSRGSMNPFKRTADIGSSFMDIMTASMYVAGATSSFTAQRSENSEAPTNNAKLDLLGDISSPTIHSSTTCTRLGDQTRPVKVRSSTSMDIYEVGKICTVPVHTDTFARQNTTEMLITLTPFPTMSHAAYIRDMFKYFRGGSKILLKFLSSPMMSARVAINLYTTAQLASVSDSVGDVMSWVLSIKGSQDWCIEVPYLQKRAWMSTDMSDYVAPVLKVSLLENLPQPYDKTVSLYCLVFQSAGDDICFAGLESFVPRVDEPAEGVFQSVMGSMSKAMKLGVSSSHPYQGVNLNVGDIMGRFGSRDSDPANFFPFPLKITDWTQGYGLDNFDYVAQLYAFYTGDTHIKMLFSNAPAGGNLNVVFGNSKTSTIGDKFKAGNSMVLSHQAVWPVVEFTFPYMCEDEFNSIHYPVGMYPQDYDWSATVSRYLIAATADFSMHYLMPVPEFFSSSRPAPINSVSNVAVSQPEEGVFQSRFTGFRNYAVNILTTVGQPNPVSTLGIGEDNLIGTGLTFEMDFSMTKVSGSSTSNIAYVALRSVNTALTFPSPTSVNTVPNCYLLLPLVWTEDSTKTSYVARASCCQSFYNANNTGTIYIGYVLGDATSVWSITGTLKITPWKHLNGLANVQNYSIIPDFNVANAEIPVYVNGSGNLPVVLIDPNPVNVKVSNSESEPVPVNITTSGVINTRVQGVVNPDQPVWITGYQ